jgi:hypothetical protein
MFPSDESCKTVSCILLSSEFVIYGQDLMGRCKWLTIVSRGAREFAGGLWLTEFSSINILRLEWERILAWFLGLITRTKTYFNCMCSFCHLPGRKWCASPAWAEPTIDSSTQVSLIRDACSSPSNACIDIDQCSWDTWAFLKTWSKLIIVYGKLVVQKPKRPQVSIKPQKERAWRY